MWPYTRQYTGAKHALRRTSSAATRATPGFTSRIIGLSSIGLRPWTVYGVGRDFGMTSEPTKAIKSVALGRHYHISYGGRQDLQYVDDVAKVFVRALEAPYHGAKSYNLRGAVVDLATFHRALVAVAPEAAELDHVRRASARHRLRSGRFGLAARPRADAEDAVGRGHPPDV